MAIKLRQFILEGFQIMLTKEQCENVLGILRNVQIGESEDVEQANDIFEKLIKEHFDNPPLKFEELIKHKFVWDNELKEFAFVLEEYKPTLLNVYTPNDLQAVSLKYMSGGTECLLSKEVAETINDYYVPNRFYRKEVVQE